MNGQPTVLPDYNMEEAAHRGGLFLDDKYPSWFQHIDTDILNMGHYRTCVLGQIAELLPMYPSLTGQKSYFTTVREWGIRRGNSDPYDSTHIDVWTLGLCLPLELDNSPERFARWDALTAVWREEIATRMDAIINEQ